MPSNPVLNGPGHLFDGRLIERAGRDLDPPSAGAQRPVLGETGADDDFCVRNDLAQLEYKCTDFYRSGDEFALRWDDPGLAIPWPVADPVLSPRDAAAQSLKDYLAAL